jgi:hypothetical protein
MHLLFPCDPFNKSSVDDNYVEEWQAATDMGMACSLFSFEDFEEGVFRPRPALAAGESIVYRGWMLRPERYAALFDACAAQGARLDTDTAQYRRCHHLPEWYAACVDDTPETVFAARDADFVAAVAGKDWPAFFVKDHVKSLTSTRGSIAATACEIALVVDLIEQYRGAVEGGVCIRRFETLLPDTEERYFSWHSRAYGRHGSVPALVASIAARIDSPFFSIDIVSSDKGQLRLIELGDGQVSDRKQWTAPQFMAMLAQV